MLPSVNNLAIFKFSSNLLNKLNLLPFIIPRENPVKIGLANMKIQTGSKELVLIVDDDALFRATIKDSLKIYNYKTLIASDGIEAIALYAQNCAEISVVLLDLMMASLDGATTIRVLKVMNPQVQIVAMSGLSFYEIGHFLDKTSICGFLHKPFTAKELLQVLQAIRSPKLR